MTYPIDPKRSKSEEGAILLILTLSITILIGLVAIVINVSYSRVAATQIQAAADSVAHAAAVSLCSSKECWDDSVVAACKTLKEQIDRGTLASRGANFDCNQLIPGTTAVALGDDYEVTFARGRWWPNGFPHPDLGYFPVAMDGEDKFEPFDRDDWQTENPVTPNFLVANAVYVKIKRKNINFFLNIFGGEDYSKDGVAVSVAGDPSPTCVAPFAIPICSLLSKNGQYRPDALCSVDRLITESKRYCAPGADCNAHPTFLWNVASEFSGRYTIPEALDDGSGGTIQWSPEKKTFMDFISGSVQSSLYPPDPSDSKPGDIEYYEAQCSLTPESPHSKLADLRSRIESGDDFAPSDYYGVFGLTKGGSTISNDSDFYQEIVSRAGACSGQSGKVDASIGDIFRIYEQGVRSKVVPSPFEENPFNSVGWSELNQTDLGMAYVPKLSYLDSATCTMSPSQGYCPSPLVEAKFPTSCPTGVLPPIEVERTATGPYDTLDKTKVWHTYAPIIAPIPDQNVPESLTPCGGTPGREGLPDPVVSKIPPNKWMIVGFTDLDMFDVSIDMDTPPVGVPLGCDPDKFGLIPFNPTGAGAPPKCNVIRTRISCDPSGNIAVNPIREPRQPLLVR